ncbi:MAG: hypothetical protein Kow0029_17170 [Candidatus Rifleibacteriota bacterium]
MCRTECHNWLKLFVFLLILSSAGILGCGLRQSNTGSLSSRIIDANGNAVVNAEVFSIFREAEKVYSGADGGFYLAELPAGINNIVILHPDYIIEERQIEIKSNETTVIEAIRLDKNNAPHKISGIHVAQVASTTAVIRWNTYRSVACNIDYGQTQSYGSIYRESRPATEHEAILENLSSETLYHFRIQYIDENSISHYSYDYSFKTEKGDRPSAPLSISLQPIKAAGTVDIKWELATASSVVGYNVYRMEKGGDWQLLLEQPLSARTTEYSDSTAHAGTFTKYAVVAVNEYVGESEMVISEYVFVPGVVNRNTKISYLDSPVVLTSDLVIAAGATLEVDPGVEFKVSEKDLAASGLDEQRVEILVSGRLVLAGTKDLPVKFLPLDGSGLRTHWAGIKVLSSDTGISTFDHVNISGCSHFALDIEARRVELNALKISYCENGLRLADVRENLNLDGFSISEIKGTAIKIEGCRSVNLVNSKIEASEIGIDSFTTLREDQLVVSNTDLVCTKVGINGTFGRSILKNALILVPDGIGIKAIDVLHNTENYIDHCTISAKNGIELASGSITIENNIIVNRFSAGETGVNNLSVLTPVYEFNNVFGFANSYKGCGPGIGAVSSLPEFVGGNPFSYELLPESPLNLADRYGSEMGRYGTSRF